MRRIEGERDNSNHPVMFSANLRQDRKMEAFDYLRSTLERAWRPTQECPESFQISYPGEAHSLHHHKGVIANIATLTESTQDAGKHRDHFTQRKYAERTHRTVVGSVIDSPALLQKDEIPSPNITPKPCTSTRKLINYSGVLPSQETLLPLNSPSHQQRQL